MKKVRKVIMVFLLLIIITAAAVAGTIWLRHAEGRYPAPQETPLITVTIAGSIARNNALSYYLSRDAIVQSAENHYLIAHYDNSLPGNREKELLKDADISAVTLPYLSEEGFAFFLEGEEVSPDPETKENLSVLYLSQIPDAVLLNLSCEIKTVEMSQIISGYQDYNAIIVKFAYDTQDWSEDLFYRNAEFAIDNGAHIVIGDHEKSTSNVVIYENGVIISGLDSFIGGRNSSSAIVSVAVYPDGIMAEVAPLEMEGGVPALLMRPWHYFQAQAFLNNLIGDEFDRQYFKGVYASPQLFTLEENADEPFADEPSVKPVTGDKSYAVAAGHRLAVEAGMDILQAGGNAVDAAVAVAYALAVVEPDGSGLGGGGIMLVHLAEENRQVVIDYRETAPSTASREEIEKLVAWPSTGIPGFVRGLEKAIEDYGTLNYADAIKPAYVLAKDGFALTNQLQVRLRNNSGKIAQSRDALRDFFRNGWVAKVGETITQPTLANTLQSIMDQGSSVFYEGYISSSIIDALKRQGATITHRDLKDYQPVVRAPISGEYRGYTIVTVPPPAGGFNVLQQLKILNHFDLSVYTENEPEFYRLIEQTMKSTYSDRRNYVGDPSFGYVELDELLSDAYVAEKVTQISEGSVPLQMYTDPYRPSDNTTHFVVVDAYGNWVSVTNTLSYLFGNGLQAEGFFLNTQLHNFSLSPSSPNYFQPGKRPYSHISPVMVFKEDLPIMALGSPGGRKIPAFLTQVMVLFADMNMNIVDAVNHPRFWSEEKKVWVETGMPKKVTDMFRQKGYEIVTLSPSAYFGRVAVIYDEPEVQEFSGSGDPSRGDGIFQAQ
ncbi:MAG: gamma-glutamyltransferase [Firmicutes bacterium]|nr:gamma-glutamyltransferase [Bacillota bacterium]